MKQYQKIQTVWLREGNKKKGKLIDFDWSKPEFNLLQNINWVGTEKIYGENIRVLWDGEKVLFKGKTDTIEDNVNLILLEYLKETFTVEKMKHCFHNSNNVCIYGEGFGYAIHHGEKYLKDTVSFRLIDVNISNWWLIRTAKEDIAKKININIVPIVTHGNLICAINYVRNGFKSTISEDSTLIAEGLVLEPAIQLFNRKGERIITKIKYKDFSR